MEVKRKRLTLDIEPALQRRLKVASAMKGISMRQYCESAIQSELSQDEQGEMERLPFGKEALQRLADLRSETFEGHTVTGDAADLLREARETRTSA